MASPRIRRQRIARFAAKQQPAPKVEAKAEIPNVVPEKPKTAKKEVKPKPKSSKKWTT